MSAYNFQLYWGILHCHIRGELCHKTAAFSADELAAAGAQIDRIYKFARDEMKFDFLAYADHHDMGGMIARGDKPDSPWHLALEKARQYAVEGQFVAILGYEYQDGRDYNVYLRNTARLPLADRWPDLIAQVKPNEPGIILAAHYRPNPTEWDFAHHPNFRVIEIVNDSGNPFEQWANEGLGQGHRGGFIGGSDDHDCKPGVRSYTGLWARSLSADDVWEALWQRRTVAATGIRPRLLVTCGEAWMGSELPGATARNFTITHKCDRVPLLLTLVRNGAAVWQKRLDSTEFEEQIHDPEGPSGRPFDYYYVKVLYADGQVAFASPFWFMNRRDAIAARPPVESNPVSIPTLRCCTVTRDVGQAIGYHRFYNAGGLVRRDPHVRPLASGRDMLTHAGPDALLRTSRGTVIVPAMDGLYEIADDGRATRLLAYGPDDYHRLTTALVEIGDAVVAAGYNDGEPWNAVVRGAAAAPAIPYRPIAPYLYRDRYVTPQYLTGDGTFLYLLGERELSVFLPNARLVASCQEDYPRFPCAVAARALREIAVLSCDGTLTAYDVSTSEHGIRRWEVELPLRCLSLACCGEEIWAFNHARLPQRPARDSRLAGESACLIMVYDWSGKLKGALRPDLVNIRGVSLAPIARDRFVALHNPNRNAAAVFRDELNRTGVLRFFQASGDKNLIN